MNIKDKIVNDLRKNYGSKSIIRGNQVPEWRVLPIGIAGLDYQLGGGLLVGRFNMIDGATNAGKTSLAYKTIAQFQKLGVACYYIDLDRFYMPERAALFGVKNEDIVIISEDLTSEMVVEMVKTIIRGHNNSEDKRCYIVIDSLAAMRSNKTMESDDVTGGYMTHDARANNLAYGIWNSLMSRNSTILVLQQQRENLAMGKSMIRAGGQAQNYYSANIFSVRQGQTYKNGNMPIGQEIKWTIEKSKTASPKQNGSVDFYFDSGFDTIKSLVETAIDMGLIEQHGAFYNILGEQIRGKEKIIEKLKTEKEFLDNLEKEVYSKIGKDVIIWDGSQIEVKEEDDEI